MDSVDHDQDVSEQRTRVPLRTRAVLWAHLGSIGCIIVGYWFGNGDIHAIRPQILYVLVIPAVFSIWCFPPLVFYFVFRNPQAMGLVLVTEAFLEFCHFAIGGLVFSH
jgi:hypothetical protein